MAQMVPGMKDKMPSEEQTKQLDERTRVFKKIVNAMTDEERKTPELFFPDGTDGPEKAMERIQQVAEKAKLESEDVTKFIMFFPGAARAHETPCGWGDDGRDRS